jgi:hypothetical protein
MNRIHRFDLMQVIPSAKEQFYVLACQAFGYGFPLPSDARSSSDDGGIRTNGIRFGIDLQELSRLCQIVDGWSNEILYFADLTLRLKELFTNSSEPKLSSLRAFVVARKISNRRFDLVGAW